MAKVTGSAVLRTTATALSADELSDFLAGVPDRASIAIEVNRGDPRDPREAGFRETVITAVWEMGKERPAIDDDWREEMGA